MNACPDCDNPLPQTATECRCGWHLPTQSVVQNGLSWAEQVADTVARQNEIAREYLKEQGLDRKPGESVEAWRQRTLEWMKDKTFKRFGQAA